MAEQDADAHVLHLPDELLAHVLRWVRASDLHSVLLTCRKFNALRAEYVADVLLRSVCG